jgi:hypothetical protein
MSWGLVTLISVAAIVAFFGVLQFWSNRTYKPSPLDMKRIIESSIAGRLDLGSYDEFACVRIAYDKRLDQIREDFKRVVDNPLYISGSVTKENATPLNDEGKTKLRVLINELENIAI